MIFFNLIIPKIDLQRNKIVKKTETICLCMDKLFKNQPESIFSKHINDNSLYLPADTNPIIINLMVDWINSNTIPKNLDPYQIADFLKLAKVLTINFDPIKLLSQHINEIYDVTETYKGYYNLKTFASYDFASEYRTKLFIDRLKTIDEYFLDYETTKETCINLINDDLPFIHYIPLKEEYEMTISIKSKVINISIEIWYLENEKKILEYQFGITTKQLSQN